MTIRIDLEDERPLEEQIVTALRNGLARGAIAPAQELPSVRQLAGDLGVHWNTVARAYRRLADEGLLSVRRGRSVVARETARSTARVSRTALRSRLTDVLAEAVLGGLSRKDVTEAFEEALAGFDERK
jgi:DNA-binding transcriptional regulator YhcF (GntR family)